MATAIGFTAVVLFGRAGEPVRPIFHRQEGGRLLFEPDSRLDRGANAGPVDDPADFRSRFDADIPQLIQPGPKTGVILEAAGYTAGITGALLGAIDVGLR